MTCSLRIRRAGWGLGILVLSACGHDEPPPPEATVPPAAAEKPAPAAPLAPGAIRLTYYTMDG